jgi:hypothetical protein
MTWGREHSWPYWDSNFEPSVVQRIVSRYNDCAIPVPLDVWMVIFLWVGGAHAKDWCSEDMHSWCDVHLCLSWDGLYFFGCCAVRVAVVFLLFPYGNYFARCLVFWKDFIVARCTRMYQWIWRCGIVMFPGFLLCPGRGIWRSGIVMFPGFLLYPGRGIWLSDTVMYPGFLFVSYNCPFLSFSCSTLFVYCSLFLT